MKTFSLSLVLLFFVSCGSTDNYSSSYQDDIDQEFDREQGDDYISLEDFLDAQKRENDNGEEVRGDDKDYRFTINKKITENIPKFQTCYKTQGKSSSGTVTLVFRIRPDGKVQRAGIMSSDLPISLKACLVEKIYNIEFEKFQGRKMIDVKQPLNF